MASGQPFAIMDGVTHPGADQGLVTEVVVAGDDLVPQFPFAGIGRDGAEVERATLVECGRGREQRRLGVGSEDDGLRATLSSPRRRQNDHAVAVHGEHGHPRHHVLEAAIGLDPSDAPAELPGQGGAGGLWIGGDQGAQKRHFIDGDVAALDRAGHPGAVNSCLRASLIDPGSQGDRSSGGLRPFSAHAVSHASMQRRTSMPFIESVPTTE